MYQQATFLFDPDCGICVAAAAWLQARVPADRLRLVPLTAAAADPRVRHLVAGRQLADTLHVVTPDGRVVTGARAVLAAGRLVPGWRVVARLWDNPIGAAVLEPVYREIARKRRRLGRALGLAAECVVPGAGDTLGA